MYFCVVRVSKLLHKHASLPSVIGDVVFHSCDSGFIASLYLSIGCGYYTVVVKCLTSKYPVTVLKHLLLNCVPF